MGLLEQRTKWQAQYLSWIFGACVPLPIQNVSSSAEKLTLVLRLYQSQEDPLLSSGQTGEASLSWRQGLIHHYVLAWLLIAAPGIPAYGWCLEGLQPSRL